MNVRIFLLLRSAFALIALISALGASSQAVFTVNGRLKIEGGDMGDTRVVVFKNGSPVRTLTDGLNKFSLDLDLQADYVMSFEKDGYVSKKLSFNTRVPADKAMEPFTPFEFAVSLFKQYSDVNVVVFNQPVGMIRYEHGLGDFDYDTDYTRSIQKQMQQTLAEVERKQKEESDMASANGKRQAAEAKERAKAEAEAARAQAEAAKAVQEAERKRALEEAAAARKVEEEKAAAARKAEEERLAAIRKAEADKKLAAEQAEADRLAEAQRVEAERIAAAKQRAEEARAAQEAEAAARAEAERLDLERRTAARKQAEAERRAAMAAATKPPPVAAPRAQPVAQPLPVMVRREPMRASSEPAVPAKAVSGSDGRRSITAHMESETRPASLDAENGANDEQSRTAGMDRSEELIVEPNKVMTVVTFASSDRVTEYRKVIHKWGGTYYFRNEESISQVTYEQEALEEQLVDVQPRSKY